GSWSPVAGETVRLTLALPPPSAGARVHGDLHLRWSGPHVAGARGPVRPLPPGFEWKERRGETEERVAEVVEKLPPGPPAALARELDERRPFLDRIPVALVRADGAAGGVAAAPSVTTVPDPAGDAQAERFLHALVDAYGGRLPGELGEAVGPKAVP